MFISHAQADASVVQQLAQALRSLGLDVFSQYSDLNPGDNFEKILRSAIEHSDVLVVLMSPEYFKSPWGQTELSSALTLTLRTEKRLLPVLLRGEPRGPISNFVYLDASHDSVDQLASKIADFAKATS